MDMIGLVGASDRMEANMESKNWSAAVEKYLARRADETGADWVKYEKLEAGYTARLSSAITKVLGSTDILLEDFTDDIVLKVRRQLSEGRKASTVNRHLVVLRRILNLGVRWKWYSEVPAEVQMLVEELPDRRFLTKEEARRLVAECSGQMRDKVICALGLGLRDQNIKGLRWDWIDWRNRVISIPASEMKAKKSLDLPIPDEVFEVLHRLNRRKTKHPELVFPWNGKIVHRSGGRSFKQAAARAGVPWCKWHTLRHSWASWMIQDGKPPHIIQKLGGWQSPAMLGIYAHVNAQHMAQYVNTGFLVR